MDRAAKLRTGTGEADYGPITMPGQLDVIAGQLDRGARPRRHARWSAAADSVRPPFVDPVVLADVPADCAAMTEETFGPTVT